MPSKRSIKVLAIFSTFLLTLSSCSNGNAKLLFEAKKENEHVSTNLDSDKEYLKVLESVNSFSSKVSPLTYDNYAKDKNENFVCSPISIYMALSMAQEAGLNETREEILDALEIDHETLKSRFNDLFSDLIYETETAKLNLTNSIWLNSNLEYKDEGLKNLASFYNTDSYQADFLNDNKGANEAIRYYIKEKTNDLIDFNLNAPDVTTYILLNTLYLKDNWLEFGEELDYYPNKVAFKNYDGTTSNVQLLEHGYQLGAIYDGGDFKAVRITTDANYTLKFIVPDKGVDVKDVFNEANLKYLNNVSNEPFDGYHKETNTYYYTNVIFPEFEASFNDNIKGMLINDLNIKSLFEQKVGESTILADNIVNYCSEVRHVSKLKVDKKGIEGAAITAIIMAGSAEPEPKNEVFQDFIVDRAFGFTLTDSSGINLFSGIVKNV